MKAFLQIHKHARVAVLTAPLFAIAMFGAVPHAAALTCDVIADQLAHQNTPLQDAATRLTVCAKKFAKFSESLSSKPKSSWKSLCEADKNKYSQLLANRQTILVQCRPRGSED